MASQPDSVAQPREDPPATRQRGSTKRRSHSLTPADMLGGATRARFDVLVQLAVTLLLAVGCWRVLSPFLPALMFAAVIASSTWPLFVRLRRGVGERSGLASLLACALTILAVLGPIFLLMAAVGDGAAWLLQLLDRAFNQGIPRFPAWLERVPLLGASLSQAWSEFGNDPQRVKSLLAYASAPARQAALWSGRVLGNSAFQGFLTSLLLYFLYRNGEAVARRLRGAAYRIGGRYALDLIRTAADSVSGVIFGILGAGLAQGMVAAAGFALAGVPNPLFLGAVTLVLSMVPIGPPIVWVGAAAWLGQQGEPAWAVFMVIYGALGISSIDNVIKPLIISRASHLPFVITLMSVVGGVLGFGVAGIFLGPTLVALCLDLGGHWLQRRRPAEPADNVESGR